MFESNRDLPPRRPDWQGRGRFETRPSKSGGRWKKLALVAAVLLALIAGLAAWLLQLSPFTDPMYVGIALSQYDRLPPPPLAHQDATRLFSLFPQDEKSSRYNVGAQQKDSLAAEIAALAERGDRPLVVHFCALARVEGGVVRVLPTGATYDDPPGRGLPLADVLGTLSRSRTKHKLLLLDVARPLAGPFRGVLVDDVADWIEAEWEKTASAGVAVLTACGPGQTALASEDLGLSPFAHYAALGLGGAADGYADGRRDGRVTLREFAAFVTDHVDRWAVRNRGVRQTPRLWPADAVDFELTVRSEPPPLDAELPESPKYAERLAGAWKRRDDRRAEGIRNAPEELRRLESVLLRAERRWRGGDEAKALADAETAASAFEKALDEEARALRGPAEPRSLALAARRGRFAPDAAIDDAIRALFRHFDAKPNADPAKALEERNAALKGFQEAVKAKPSLFVAWSLLRLAAADPNPRPDRLGFLNDMVERLSPRPRFVETLALARLAGVAKDEERRNVWPTAALRVVRLGEEAAQVDARVFPFVRTARAVADRARAEGEARLFDRRLRLVREADPFLREAATAYERLLEQADALRRAHDSLEEALALLPAALPYLDLFEDVSCGRAFDEVARSAAALGRLLDPERPTTPGALQAEALPLAEALGRLRKPFEPSAVKALAARAAAPDAGPAILREIDAVLASPAVDAKGRAGLWDAARTLGRRLHAATAESDADDASRKRRSSVPAGAAASNPEARAERLLARELTLLGLAGVDEAKRTAARAADGWEARGRALRRLWAEEAPAEQRRRLERKELLAADRVSRMLCPLDAGTAAAATPLLRRRQEAAQWAALAEAYRGRADAADKDLKEILDVAAEEYRRAAP